MNITFKKKLTDSNKKTDFLRRLEITLISHDLLKRSKSKEFRNLVVPDILCILDGFQYEIEEVNTLEINIK